METQSKKKKLTERKNGVGGEEERVRKRENGEKDLDDAINISFDIKNYWFYSF